MAIDFNTAEKQREVGELMPDGTIAPVRMSMRGIKQTNAKDAKMLDCEFVITAGEFAKRRFWGMMMVTSNGSDGHNKAVDITMSRVRGMIESAYGIDPSDDSTEAMTGRRLDDWEDLDGLEFVAKIGVEKSKDDRYPDKNVLKSAVTPDQDEYQGFKPAKRKSAGKAMASASSEGSTANRPAWA